MTTNQCARLLPSSRLLASGLLLLAPLASQPALAQTRHIELNDYTKITSVFRPADFP
jgi:hypothetical protein